MNLSCGPFLVTLPSDVFTFRRQVLPATLLLLPVREAWVVNTGLPRRRENSGLLHVSFEENVGREKQSSGCWLPDAWRQKLIQGLCILPCYAD